MCQDSSKHHWRVWEWWSMTVTWSQSMAWLMVIACSAAAEKRQFPVARALPCSFTCCMRDLPFWPMYALGQAEQRGGTPCQISVQGV